MVGFSAFVSVGSMLDVGWGDLIDYLGDDPKTRSIVIYMESIGDARAFLSAAREVALQQADHRHQAGPHARPPRRPPHRTPARSPAATKCSKPPSAACGVLRVNNISDLFYMAEVLAKQPRPQGPAPDHRDQRRRSGRARHRRPDHGRRRTGRAHAGDHGSLQRSPAAHLEPQQPGGHPRRRRRPNATPRRSRSRRRIRTATACW